MKTARANWRTTILVCRKCSKKAGGGFGDKGRTGLAKALRAAAGLGKGRKATAGIVEVGCLKICPRRGITVIDAAAPGEWLIVEPGAPVADLAARLRLTS